MGHRGIDNVPPRCVYNALGLSGGAGCVKNKQWIFRVHFFWWAVCRGRGHGSAVGMIAAFFHSHISVCTFHNERGDIPAYVHCLVHIRLKRCNTPTTGRFIRCHDKSGAAILDTACQCLWGKPAKDDGMDRTDTRAGKHGIGRFGDHRHIKDNTVCFLHAQRFVNIG